ncbi:MAG: pitrilysin family protein [Pseudomonadota bacterium]
MNRGIPLFLAVLMFACASGEWRATHLKSASIVGSDVFEIDSFNFAKGLTVKKFRLSNGLKVIVLEDHSAPIFAYHTWFNVGSRNEKEGTTGIAHLFEHLMFKETKNLKEGEFDRILEEQGGSINAGTYVDWTFYHETVPAGAFAQTVSLEADRMQNMILSDMQVNSERDVVANERRFRVDNSPSGTMYEELFKKAFVKHPYHWPVIGWMKDIQTIPTKDCIEFYRTYYAPNNATVVVVGDVDTENVLKRINQAYGRIPASKIPAELIPSEPPQEKERRGTLKQEVPSEKLLVGYRIPNALSPDYPALEVAHAILFDGKSSRLYRKLITDTQIASEAGGWVNQTKDPGLYIIDITMKSKIKADKAEKLVYEELARLSKEKVPARELEKAKNRLETSFWGNFKTMDGKAQAMGFYETTAGDYRKLFDEVKSYRAVTVEDVKRTAETYFAPRNRTVITGIPLSKP